MDFSRLARYIDSLEGKYGVPACDLAVFIRHKEVFRRSAGFSDTGKTKPVSSKDLYWIYSMTKVYTATAALQLAEQGRLGLEDPVAEYLPAFSKLTVKEGDTVRPAREVLRIRHLFTMTGGLNYDLQTPAIMKTLKKFGSAVTSKELCDALAAGPLDFDPGAHYLYSVCIDVLGRVVEVISGVGLGEYFQKNLFGPLGASDIAFFPDEEQKARLSAQYAVDAKTGMIAAAGPDNLLSPLGKFESGGGGLASTLDAYALLPNALANGGTAGSGAQILKPETIELMRRDWLTPVQRADFNKMKPADYSYGLGVRTRIQGGTAKSPVGEFGWDGAAGAYNLIDPANNLAAVYTQHVLGHNVAFDMIHPTIRDLIYEGLNL